ncbi:MAG: hypothetical protein RL223_3693 [Pseudomonadota bacterium]|jgi:glycosyltransferase involved in cell wall biosynthesis
MSTPSARATGGPAEAGSSARPPLRVMHVVTGGFSGATQVAVDIAHGEIAEGHAVRLVLRRKRQTAPERVQALRDSGLTVDLVPGWSNLVTVAALWRLYRQWRPDVLVAHGFSDHLWARHAGWLAGVPVMVQVEHNSRERYGRWRLWQTRWLAQRTAAIVGVSEGVAQALHAQGLPPQRIRAIANGIRTERFDAAADQPWAARSDGLVMAARFAGQKDHASLLQALALLRDHHGLRPTLHLAGGGKARHADSARALCTRLGLDEQVRFLGHVADLPGLLMSQRLCVLSSHYEGMPLSLIEGMAAGCLAIGSDVPGIRELLRDGDNGRLVPHADPQALAEVIAQALRDPDGAAAMAARGRAEALTHYTLPRMTADYCRLFEALAPRP